MTSTQQHRCEAWASNLLYLTFLVSLVTDYVLGRGYFAPHKSQGQYLELYLATPLLLLVYYYIRQGLRGAKVFFLVTYAFVLFHLFSEGVSPSAYDTELEAFSLLTQHGLQIMACLLILLSLRPVEEEATRVT